MSRIRRIAPGLGRGGLLGNIEGPEAYLRELDTLPSQFCRATGGTETVISQGGKFYRVHTFTDTDPTSLLLNFDGSNGSTTFTDDSGWGHAVTANGDAEISTTQSKFGGSSAYFDGTGDYLSVPDSPLFEFGSGDFTVECWFYIAGNSSQNAGGNRPAALVTKLPSSGSTEGFAFNINGDGSTTGTGLSFFAYSGGSTVFSAFYSGSVTQSAWHHAAVCRNGSNLYLFLDGSQVQLTTGISGSIPDTAHSLSIGKSPYINFEHPLNGYIDSLRIVKGQALYTAAFTPPTQALTRVGSGSLTFTRGGAVEYLVVGGGGGGGSFRAGGGGAGGYRSSVVGESSGGGASAEPKKIATAKHYSVTVGSGGSGGPYTSNATGSNGASGQESSLDEIIAQGGGGGGNNGQNGIAGGSGGGGGGSTTSQSGGSGESGQGYAGGDNGRYGSGGGGGAGAVGVSGVVDDAGNGGDGVQSSIDGTATYRSGGGGGGTYLGGTSPSVGSGGSGGGTAGGSVGASDASVNTGGGGGGGSQGGPGAGTTGGPGGSGGSGIVIARYRITQAEYEAEAA